MLRAYDNPEMDAKHRDLMPGAMDRIFRYADDLGCERYEEDGFPDDGSGRFTSPSKEDFETALEMILASDAEEYTKCPDGKWARLSDIGKDSAK